MDAFPNLPVDLDKKYKIVRELGHGAYGTV
jgi:hypothetical protein